MNSSTVLIANDGDLLGAKAAEFVAACAQQAVHERGRFVLALSGGSSPAGMYTCLAEHDRKAVVSWAKTFVFFSDERFVAHSDERSNYGLARRLLLSQVPIPLQQIFAAPTHVATAADAAALYSAALAAFFSASPTSPPRFDLILLGMGDDGHTASLFPGSPAIQEEDAWVTSSQPMGLPPFVDRVTFTYPTINAARHVGFLVSGAKKAELLRTVMEGQVGRDVYPAAGVRPVDGHLTWIVDKAAARLLPQS